LACGDIVTRPVSMAVQVLDISTQGALLACPDPLYPGTMRRIVARLGGFTLEAGLHVRHASDKWDHRVGGYRAGGEFSWLSPIGCLAIEDFTNGREQ
jgi:hypothetical protein